MVSCGLAHRDTFSDGEQQRHVAASRLLHIAKCVSAAPALSLKFGICRAKSIHNPFCPCSTIAAKIRFGSIDVASTAWHRRSKPTNPNV